MLKMLKEGSCYKPRLSTWHCGLPGLKSSSWAVPSHHSSHCSCCYSTWGLQAPLSSSFWFFSGSGAVQWDGVQGGVCAAQCKGSWGCLNCIRSLRGASPGRQPLKCPALWPAGHTPHHLATSHQVDAADFLLPIYLL